MIVRVVTLKSKAGAEEELRRFGRELLVPVNKEAGCKAVYFLEPSIEDNNFSFGVVSTWESKEVLNEIKSSKKYRDLVEESAPLVESVEDNIYFTL